MTIESQLSICWGMRVKKSDDDITSKQYQTIPSPSQPAFSMEKKYFKCLTIFSRVDVLPSLPHGQNVQLEKHQYIFDNWLLWFAAFAWMDLNHHLDRHDQGDQPLCTKQKTKHCSNW